MFPKSKQRGFLLNPFRFGVGAPPPPVTDPVVLFPRFDNVNNSTIFKDYSSYNKTLTRTGTSVISTVQSKFGGSSLAVAAAGELMCNDADLALGTGDFTIEGFLYWITASGVDKRGAFQFGGGATGFSASSATTIAILAETGSVWAAYLGGAVRTTAVAITLSTWHHILIARTAGVSKVFLNGTEIISVADTVNYAQGAVIGSYVSTAFRFDGYIDQVRVKKGVADYTANFTVPTVPYSVRHVLLHGDGTNAATNFDDSIPYPRVWTPTGAAKLNTANKKFGTASMDFVTSGSYIASDVNAHAFAFGTTDFCVDFWMQRAATTDDATAITTTTDGSAGGGWWFNFAGTGINVYNAAQLVLSTTAVGSATGAMIHWALTRQGTTFRVFKNGALLASSTYTPGFISDTGKIRIGGADLSGFAAWTLAYIDEMNVVVGDAVYTSAFTPPTAPYA